MRLLSLFASLNQAAFVAQSQGAANAASAGRESSPLLRDYDRYPVVARLTDAQAPSRLAAMGDNHAAFNQTIRVLMGAGIVAPCKDGPKTDGRCGELDQADWGDFRFANPYCWSGGDMGLVKTGDDFDKGAFNLVTACFWLDMVHQAERAGGFVWPLWGNHEASILDKATNSKSMGPGGLNFELLHYGIDPSHFTSDDHPFGHALRRRPVLARIGPFFFSHAGNSKFQSLAKLERDIIAGLRKDGPNCPVLNDEDGLLRSRSPGGAAGVRGPDLAAHLDSNASAPVRTIIFGHDPERAPRGKITAYSPNAQDEPSLIDIDVGLSPTIGYSGFVGGSLLLIDQEPSRYVLAACTAKGQRSYLGEVSRLYQSFVAQSMPAAQAGQPNVAWWRSTLFARPRGQAPQQSFRLQPRAQTLAPGRRQPHGITRNFTAFPTIVSLDQADEVVVMGATYGELRRTKALLASAQLIGPMSHQSDHAPVSANRARPPAALDVNAPVRWTGGTATLVQLGNQFGYGYGNLENIDLFQQLAAEAERAGGRVISLLGAREVDLLADPENDDTWGPGGIGIQLTGLDLSPTRFLAHNTSTYSLLRDRPFGVYVHGSLILPAGQTSGRNYNDTGADLAEALRQDGFAAELVSGDNSCTKSIGFAGRDGHQGPKLAAAAGVKNIIHGYDEQMAPMGHIKAYGKKSSGLPSLFNVETGFNAAKNLSDGWLLRLQPRGRHIHYRACDSRGKCHLLAKDRR